MITPVTGGIKQDIVSTHQLYIYINIYTKG